jgi:hypothetical protein
MLTTGKVGHFWSIFKSSFGIFWRSLFSDHLAKGLAIVALSLNAINWIGSAFIFHFLTPKLAVIHYNIDFGIDLVGTRGQVFTSASWGVGFLIVDMIILFLLYKQPHFKFIYRLMLGAAVLSNFFLLLATLAVYITNFR